MTTFFASLGAHLGLEVVARVVVRRERRELARAGVDGLEHRPHAELPARVADLLLGEAAQLRDLDVGEAVLLRQPEEVGIDLSATPRSRSATSLMSTIWSRNQGSIFVASNACSTVAPLRSACWTVMMRPSVGILATSSSSSAERGSSPQWKLLPRFSSERSAFCSAVE